MKDTVLLVYCTVPTIDEAKTISRILVDKKLAACCTSLPNATSIFRWEGNTEESSETLLLIKSTQKKYEQLEKEIKMIHSYSVPEIIATKIKAGSKAYIDWIYDCVNEMD